MAIKTIRVAYGWPYAEERVRLFHLLPERDNLNCLRLATEQPLDSWKCKSYSDKLASYNLFPFNTKVNKGSGKTNHIENFNNIVRQRNARYVPKTLSFSKCKKWHDIATKFFILSYNLDIKNS